MAQQFKQIIYPLEPSILILHAGKMILLIDNHQLLSNQSFDNLFQSFVIFIQIYLLLILQSIKKRILLSESRSRGI